MVLELAQQHRSGLISLCIWIYYIGWRGASDVRYAGFRPKWLNPKTIYLNPIKSINIFLRLIYSHRRYIYTIYLKPFHYHCMYTALSYNHNIYDFVQIEWKKNINDEALPTITVECIPLYIYTFICWFYKSYIIYLTRDARNKNAGNKTIL